MTIVRLRPEKGEGVPVQLEITDTELAMFEEQARCEGLSLEDWLWAAAHDRLAHKPKFDRKPRPKRSSQEPIREFLERISGQDGPEREPDWEEHLRVIDRGIWRGATET